MGQQATGKTSSWLNIAKWYEETDTPGTFYVLDTDNAVPRMLTNYSFPESRVDVFPCYEWPDYMEAGQTALRHANPSDWIIIDMIGRAWETVQEYYTQQVYSENIGNYFLKVRKELSDDSKSLATFSGWTDWSVINALYRQWINPLIYSSKAHILACTSIDRPTGQEDDQIRALTHVTGYKPAGQKNLPYQFHTILYTQPTFILNTVKDREREPLVGKKLTQFALDYLKGVGGWQIDSSVPN